MTIETITNKIVLAGNGAATQFDWTFRIDRAEDLVVIVTDSFGNETTVASNLFTATGYGNDAGGTVTYPLSGPLLASNQTITILRSLALEQTTNLTNQSTLYPDAIEGALDRTVMMLQQLNELFDRVLQYPVSETGSNNELPPAATRANKYFAFDANGNPSISTTVDPGLLVVSAFVETLLNLASAPAFRSAIGVGATGTLGQAGADTLLGNPTGSTADPTFNSLISYIARIGNTRGMTLRRGASAWETLALGASGQLLGSNGTDLTYVDPPFGEGLYRNLVIECTSGSNVDVDADWVTLANATNSVTLRRSVNLSIGTGTSGANGLDTSTIANDTWYAVWIIYNPTTDTLAGLLSLSSSAPTLPSGFTFRTRFGWVRYATGALRRTKQVNRRAMYVLNATHTTYPALSAGTSMGDVSITGLVPATAVVGGFLLSVTTPSDAAAISPNNIQGASYISQAGYLATEASTSDYIRKHIWLNLESTNVYAGVGSGGGTISVVGWEDSV